MAFIYLGKITDFDSRQCWVAVEQSGYPAQHFHVHVDVARRITRTDLDLPELMREFEHIINHIKVTMVRKLEAATAAQSRRLGKDVLFTLGAMSNMRWEVEGKEIYDSGLEALKQEISDVNYRLFGGGDLLKQGTIFAGDFTNGAAFSLGDLLKQGTIFAGDGMVTHRTGLI